METLIEDLRGIFDAGDNINIETVRILLENYKSDYKDWSKYAHFDPHKYTRNLVDAGNGKYNLMILCWGPSIGSSIHDHTNSHCFVKILYGVLKETRYAWPEISKSKNEKPLNETDECNEKPMIQISTDEYLTNGVTYINDEIGLHRMENPSHSDSTITLHLYIPPYQHCQIFDERTGHHMKSIVTFYTKYGEIENYRKK